SKLSVMERKYLAFDIETAKILPEDAGSLKTHRPLGISCAAAWPVDRDEPAIFYSSTEGEGPAARMSQKDLSDMVDFLLKSRKNGYTILTHNGLGFDFDILAEESGRTEECRRMALQHVDMMFHIFCKKGFGVGLNAAAKGIGKSKTEGMQGSLAPKLWKERKHQKVLDYVSQDCRLTLDIARQAESSGSFQWITQRGKRAFLNIPSGWLSVAEAQKLPLPDTSWMDNPWKRSRFDSWLN